MISDEFINGIRQWFPNEDLPNDYSLIPSLEKRQKASEDLKEATRKRVKAEADMAAEAEAKRVADQKWQEKMNRQYQYGMDYSDSEESDHFQGGCGQVVPPPATPKDPVEPFEKFITALSDCPMILGFHSAPTRVNAEKCCYCPCGDKLKSWRDAREISVSSCGSARYSANGLMAHLREKSDPQNKAQTPCVWHWMTLTYLEILYADFWGPGIGHKGLYKVNDAKYNEAVIAEVRMDLRMKRRLEAELALAQQERDKAEARAKELEEAKETCPHLVEDLKRKLKMRDDLLVCLGLAERVGESEIKIIESPKEADVSKEEMENFRTLQKSFKELWQLRFNSKNTQEVKRIEVRYPAQLSLKEWFLKNSENDNDMTCLFKELNDRSVGRFFVKWNVEFEAPIKKVKIKRNLNDTMIAKDEGGPTREFLSIVWKQIGEISVNVGKGDIVLFQDTGDRYLLPRYSMVGSSFLPEKAYVYYRAIGRIFAYCIVHGEEIADHVMPNLYKNFLLKDISPLDPSYKLKDLVSHVFEMIPTLTQKPCAEQQDIISIFIDNFGDDPPTDECEAAIEIEHDLPNGYVDDGSVEAKFRICVYREYIWNRKKALESILSGIRLKEFIEPKSVFRVMPLHSLEGLLFCKQEFNADDIINCLHVEYDDQDDQRNWLIDSQKMILEIDEETGERCGILVNVLRDRSRIDVHFLKDFVWFVTGSSFLPRSNIKIMVEFNYLESSSFDSLPVSHTCHKTLKLPGYAYNGDREMFEMKLDASIQNSKKFKFDMS